MTWTPEQDAFLADNYRTLEYVEIAVLMGKSVGAIRNRRLRKLPPIVERWSDAEITMLKEAYENKEYNKDIDVPGLSIKLGRHPGNVSRKARQFGLTDKNRCYVPKKIKPRKYATDAELSVAISAWVRKAFSEKGHPRGMLGKTHTQAVKDRLAKTSLRTWKRMTKEQQQNQTERALKTKMQKYGSLSHSGPRNASWKAGWREIGGINKYYRSRWEANYARYLQWLKERGEIANWEHEPHCFWFEGIKRGVRSYLPDFKVTEKNGSHCWHEVKGWMDAASKTKTKRMAKYFPKEKLIIIGEKQYKSIKKTISKLIVGWE